MSQPPRIVVAGLGAIGSAVALHLARRGARVVGLDAHRPPHALGSSHGGTRILREAYFEAPLYVPLVQRALALWRELEAASGASLFVPTGGLALGAPDTEVVRGALASAHAHRLPHSLLDATQLRRRFPAFAPPPETVAVHEPRAGALRVERCIEVALALAADAGAELRCDEPLLDWQETDGELRARTTTATIACDALVLAAGAWLPPLLAGAGGASPLRFAVERAVQHWFAPRDAASSLGPESLPVFVWEHLPGRMWYGIPDLGDGMKAAVHHGGEVTDAERVRREVAPAEVAEVQGLVRRYLPAADGAHRGSRVCLYTNTPDLHFVVDRHDSSSRVTVVSACSGHGFKFAPALGEAVAADVLGLAPTFELAPFRLARFAAATAAVAPTPQGRREPR